MASPPRVWSREDIPGPEDAQKYLDMVQAIRSTLPALPELPEGPEDMEHCTFQEANDLEAVLVRVGWAVEAIAQSRVYSGEFQSGGI